MKTRILFVVLLALVTIRSLGYSPSYCPFGPKQYPVSQVTPCKTVHERRTDGQELYVYVSYPTVVTVQRADPNGPFTASVAENGKTICGPIPLDGTVSLGLRVWTGDLTADNDGHQDVVIGTAHSGNGLAACVGFACFFLRTQNNCRTLHAISYNLDANDFVDLDNDGRLEWIQTEFIHGTAGRDKKAHNYWVMNLIHFRHGRPVLANAIDERFPSWIWFTYKPNHTNTTQLSDKQKKTLFQEQAIGLEIYTQ